MANIIQTGGSNTKLNVFCQPNAPEKEQGIWLKTSEYVSPKKVVFDTSVWSEEQWILPSPIKELTPARTGACCTVVNDEIYIIGGQVTYNTTTSDSKIYNPTTNTYRSAGISTSRATACCATSNNKIYIFGGMSYSGGSDYFSDALMYDPTTNIKKSIASMPKARYQGGCGVIGDKIYLIGGETSSNSPNSSSLVYNTTLNTYSEINIGISRRRFACTAIGGEIFYFGGDRKSGDKYSSYKDAYAYLPETDTKRTLAELPEICYGMSCVSVGENIYIIGGRYVSTVLSYNILTDTYREIGNLSLGRSNPSCACVKDRIYIFGGEYDTQDYTGVADCLSLTSKQYNDDPTVIIYYLPKDTSHYASLMENHQMSWHPTYFKDAMLYINGKVTFPAVYCGDGENWNLIREEQ